jgi:hypothetical protein
MPPCACARRRRRLPLYERRPGRRQTSSPDEPATLANAWLVAEETTPHWRWCSQAAVTRKPTTPSSPGKGSRLDAPWTRAPATAIAVDADLALQRRSPLPDSNRRPLPYHGTQSAQRAGTSAHRKCRLARLFDHCSCSALPGRECSLRPIDAPWTRSRSAVGHSSMVGPRAPADRTALREGSQRHARPVVDSLSRLPRATAATAVTGRGSDAPRASQPSEATGAEKVATRRVGAQTSRMPRSDGPRRD